MKGNMFRFISKLIRKRDTDVSQYEEVLKEVFPGEVWCMDKNCPRYGQRFKSKHGLAIHKSKMMTRGISHV